MFFLFLLRGGGRFPPIVFICYAMSAATCRHVIAKIVPQTKQIIILNMCSKIRPKRQDLHPILNYRNAWKINDTLWGGTTYIPMVIYEIMPPPPTPCPLGWEFLFCMRWYILVIISNYYYNNILWIIIILILFSLTASGLPSFGSLGAFSDTPFSSLQGDKTHPVKTMLIADSYQPLEVYCT